MNHQGHAAVFHPQQTQGYVLCCLCGTNIMPNPANMCVNCIRSQVDITEGIQKQVTILWCKECGRYLQPPKHWVRAEPESKELLTFCTKRIRGLQKVKLVDAGFIWTEPHSKRLKVKLTIQDEVMNGTILQQGFVVEFVVENHMCLECNRANANPNSWTACVQVRQHVPHKRTFLYLEQLILRAGADAQCINIKDNHEGLDFFFANRAHGLKIIDFLQGVVPARFRSDKQLVSHDIHTSTYNYKYTFSVEIAPVCKDDLICLPAKLASSLGSLGPLVLCSRITNVLTLLDPTNLRAAHMEAPVYWRTPFQAMMSARQLVEYVVLDIEPLQGAAGSGYGAFAQGGTRWCLAEAQVARKSDFGRNDTVFYTKTHLGHILHPGDHALGYDIANANLVNMDFEAHVNRGGAVPDVVLVRKSYEEKRRKTRGRGGRSWKLKHLPIEAGEDRGRNEAAEAADRERFMEELEEDAEMRARVALYKAPAAAAAAAAGAGVAAAAAVPAPRGMDSDEDSEGELPQVPLDELLDDLEGLGLDDDEAAAAAAGGQHHHEGGSDMMED
uniref:60S ribosomal export protein NMD3 n=1 Tax=Tetradesmus obliquus TaxID=3088 RepID=A0A383VQ78_TETOB|eukprot:jgi/Sobl393_1/11581/SZX66999.1